MTGQCARCSGPTELFLSGKPRKYCPSCAGVVCACGARKSKEHARCRECSDSLAIASSVRVRKPFTCEWCSEAFGRRAKRLGDDDRRFCSQRCAYAHRRARTPVVRAARRAAVAAAYAAPRICAQCGDEFAVAALNQKYCGPVCRRRHDNDCMNARNRSKRGRPARAFVVRRAPRTAYCIQCGAVFQCSPLGQLAQYCSASCQTKTQNGKRRAWKRGRAAEPIGMATLMMRDAGVCHICHLPVRPEVKAPHPMAPSIDHVVPLSRGGTHTLANTKVAHFRCNYMKRDRLMEELSVCV